MWQRKAREILLQAATATRARKVENNCGIAVVDRMIGGQGGRKRHGEEMMRGGYERKKERMASPDEDDTGETGEKGQGDGEDTVARVYRELWLSLASVPPPPKELPCVHRREEAPAARKGYTRGRLRREELEGRGREPRRGEDRNLLGSECNFIVNLSLSEGKQWSDLRTICPCHLYLHLAQFFTLPSPCLSSSPPPPPPPSRKFEGEPGLRRRGIAASHLSRGSGPAESLPICKRVADGHHCHPAGPPPLGIYRHYIEGQISRMPGHIFFRPPPSSRPDVPRTRFLFGCNPR